MDWMGLGGRKFSRNGKSLYAELEIQKGASESDIKRQYRKLALKYHPDKNPGNPESAEKFKEINRANRLLTDPTKKEIYDKYGSFGIHLADTVGDENVNVYANLSSWWCQALIICSTICTFCCCCCCCCCCCGKLLSEEEEERPTEEELDSAGSGPEDANGNGESPTVTNQPRSSTSHETIYIIPMPETSTP